MIRSALYARYSSSLQRPTSIEDQVALCRQAAPRLGCEIVDDLVFTDVERSGAVAQRPGYQRLLEAARRGGLEAIIVEAQDRLWRSQSEMHRALEELRFHGVQLFSVETGTELTGRAGRLLASFKGIMDEDYIQTLREKTRRGMLGQLRRGMSPGGHPYGYRSEVMPDAGSRRIVHPEEAAVVLRIFTLYASGQSPKAIAKQLNEEGVTPPRWRAGKPNRGWAPSAINGQRQLALGILNNPIYVGQQVWNRTRKVRDPYTGRRLWRLVPRDEWVITHVPELRIVHDALWEAVQARRDEVGRRHPRGGAPARYLLSGLLVCGSCGCAYSMVGGSGRYGCQGYYDRGICGNAQLVRRDLLEAQIVGLVCDQMLSPAARVRIAQSFQATVQRILRGQPVDASRLREVEAEVGNLVEAIAAGAGEIPELVARLRRAKEQAARLQAQMQPRPQPTDLAREIPGALEQYLTDLGQLMKGDVAGAREQLRRFLGTITLQPREGSLLAIVQGNVAGIVGNLGAGGPALELPTKPYRLTLPPSSGGRRRVRAVGT